MSKKDVVREILEKFVKDIIGKDLKIKPNIQPTHGNCCTCQVCGYNHDDCNCEIREAIKWIDQTLPKLKALCKVEICPYCKQNLSEEPLGNPDKGYGGEIKC